MFATLTQNLMQGSAHGLIGLKQEDPSYSDSIDIKTILKIFEPYKFELLNDGFLEFGIIKSDSKTLNEVFVTSFKYIRVWTNDINTLTATLKQLKINEIPNLQFIDDFPIDSYALKADKEKGIRHYTEIIENIENEFIKYNSY